MISSCVALHAIEKYVKQETGSQCRLLCLLILLDHILASSLPTYCTRSFSLHHPSGLARVGASHTTLLPHLPRQGSHGPMADGWPGFLPWVFWQDGP